LIQKSLANLSFSRSDDRLVSTERIIAGKRPAGEGAERMSAATIVFARADLSIPGAAEIRRCGDDEMVDAETRFFNLVRESNPDVIVLDLSRDPSVGVASILKLRRRCRIPILVVCDLSHPSAREFRIAGAAECIPTPVDILVLNERLQQIIEVTQGVAGRQRATPEIVSFAGYVFYPHRDLLAVPNGATLTLTTSESRLLFHFVSHPWRLCPRVELAAALSSSKGPASDRAIDIVINRLRRKLVVLRGAAARAVIKTEFRRGYLLVAGVSTSYERHGTDAAA
jgi:two-component system, OmpR family, response regulator